MGKAVLLWIDLEMTGLDPEHDRIMEVAAIATGWDLEEIDHFTGVVHIPTSIIKKRMVGDFWEKHPETRDNLIAQNASGQKAAVVEDELLAFLDKNFGHMIYLAGNSIHQDRKFIDREWPRLAERLHYRMLDVSAWKVYFEGAKKKRFTKPEEHRALDDIQGSIEELRYYIGMIK